MAKRTRSDKGTPRKLNDDVTERVAEYVRAGHSYRAATAEAGVPWQTHLYWMRRGQDCWQQGAVSSPYARYFSAVQIARGRAEFEREALLLAMPLEQDGDGRRADPPAVRFAMQWLERMGSDVADNEWRDGDEVTVRIGETIHERIAATLPELRETGCPPDTLAAILRILGGVGSGEPRGPGRGVDDDHDAPSLH